MSKNFENNSLNENPFRTLFIKKKAFSSDRPGASNNQVVQL
jgi:hypothetical protein